MSTYGVIAKKYKDGSLKAIITHSDGYPDHHWLILNKYYRSSRMVDKLMSLGELASLGKTPEKCGIFKNPKGKTLKFDNMEKFAKRFRDDGFVYIWVGSDVPWFAFIHPESGWPSGQPKTDKFINFNFSIKQPDFSVIYKENEVQKPLTHPANIEQENTAKIRAAQRIISCVKNMKTSLEFWIEENEKLLS